MNTIINVYKPVGYTPLELIQRLKKSNPEYESVTLGYAGRLDPMAEGVLLILAGEENKKRKKYELLPKKYTFEVLFGIETDTYDCMGIIQLLKTDLPTLQHYNLSAITAKYIGTWEQPYPPYSSPRVQGKPLFYWARNNKLSEIEIPKKKITVDLLKFMNVETLNSTVLLEAVKKRLSLVTGDFRQETIIKKWEEELKQKNMNFMCATFAIQCSSGLYVRSLAHNFGIQLGTGAIAWSINRTAVGQYTSAHSLNLMDTS